MILKQRLSLTIVLLMLCFSSVTLAGCSSFIASNTPEETPTETLKSTPQTQQVSTNTNDMENYRPRLEGEATVEMQINGSTVVIEVNGNDAPITAGNFVDLVDQGVYDGLVFHRVVKSPQPFVAQGGDPKGNGTGGFIDKETKRERNIPLEIKLKPKNDGDEGEIVYHKNVGQQAGISSPSVVLNHSRGAVAMARSQMPDSASSQFYFALSDLGFLDGDYAVFGYVTSGMETVDGINQGDTITSAKVTKGLENLQRSTK